MFVFVSEYLSKTNRNTNLNSNQFYIRVRTLGFRVRAMVWVRLLFGSLVFGKFLVVFGRFW